VDVPRAQYSQEDERGQRAAAVTPTQKKNENFFFFLHFFCACGSLPRRIELHAASRGSRSSVDILCTYAAGMQRMRDFFFVGREKKIWSKKSFVL
jgi:hypothetical protein